MSLTAVIPGVPMAHEQAIVRVPVLLRLARLINPLGSAVEIGTIGEYVHAHGEAIAARRDFERVYVDRQACDLHRLTAIERQAPHLRAAGARREEVQAPAVRRPARIGVVAGVARQAARLDFFGIEIKEPQIRPALVGIHVGFVHGERHVTAIG